MTNILKHIILLLSIPFITSCNLTTKKANTDNSKAVETNINLPALKLNKPEMRAPLMISRDFGMSWLPATDDLPADLQVSFLERLGNEIVIASDNKGIFKSQQNISHWVPISSVLPNQKINALHTSDKDIYAGIYRAGIYKTNEHGHSWTSLNHDLPNLNVQSIFTLNDRLLVGTDAGVFTLFNQTNKWRETNLKVQVVSLYEYDGVLVAGTSQGTAISKDLGESWKWIRQEGAVHYTHNIGKRIVELAINGDLVFSDDWGVNWNQTAYTPRIGSYVYEIIGVGAYQFISNNYGIHRSQDGGNNWELIFKTESMAFFDFISIGDVMYGGTRTWDEYRDKQ